MTTIIHIACAGSEHIGRVEGNRWKKALKRQMLVLYDAVKVTFIQDQKGNIGMNLMDMKKTKTSSNSIETKYEGTVYIQLSTQYPYYIWPVETDGGLYNMYKNVISDSDLLLPPDKKIIDPASFLNAQQMDPRRKH